MLRPIARPFAAIASRMMLLLDPTPIARGLVRKKVEVVNYPDGRFAVQFEGVSLPFRKFDKTQTVKPGEIVENKRLGAALAMTESNLTRTRAAATRQTDVSHDCGPYPGLANDNSAETAQAEAA